MSSSSSDENKKMKSMIEDDDEIKATREKLMLDFHKDVESKMSSSSSDENKKMKSMIEDDDEIKATREKLMLDFHKDVEASFGDKLRSVTYWGSLQMRRVADDKACRCRQLVTSTVGLSPILGNPSSQITGSAENIGGRSSIKRSMRSGGGLSVPCLISRLNLNTDSGFGHLSSAGNIGDGSSIGRSKSSRGGSSSKVTEFFCAWSNSAIVRLSAIGTSGGSSGGSS
uniref:Transcription regulator NOT2/NOT3/NOT5-like protein n=1 Tax=Tanacetum cinerariifolium TaxID=118510 RepID=A0A6L2J7C7_TANCI|nr:transcription regulator NOT2/NOT3/NOT5-like protein [Tanacetum cinerariifolium]